MMRRDPYEIVAVTVEVDGRRVRPRHEALFAVDVRKESEAWIEFFNAGRRMRPGLEEALGFFFGIALFLI